MDGIVIDRKLESLRRCVARVKSKRPATLTELIDDIDLQDVLVLNLSRAIQLCVDIGAHLLAATEQPAPTSMGETFTLLAQASVISPELATRLRRAVGFRNIAVHNYEVIDWAIVHALSEVSVADFAEFAAQVVAYLPES